LCLALFRFCDAKVRIIFESASIFAKKIQFFAKIYLFMLFKKLVLYPCFYALHLCILLLYNVLLHIPLQNLCS